MEQDFSNRVTRNLRDWTLPEGNLIGKVVHSVTYELMVPSNNVRDIGSTGVTDKLLSRTKEESIKQSEEPESIKTQNSPLTMGLEQETNNELTSDKARALR
jgi:hypothetical protein